MMTTRVVGWVAVALGCAGVMAGTVGASTEDPAEPEAQHAVLVFLKLQEEFGTKEERERIYQLEISLETAIEQQNAGEFDGNEFGDGFCTLYMYGPDAERLAQVIMPALQAWHPAPGSYMMKRYGEPGANEDRIDLGPEVTE